MNENQKVVLYELKSKKEDVFGSPFSSVKRITTGDLNAYKELSEKEEFEVLAEFAKWGLKNEN